MTRQRMFLDMTCVDAARERMRHIYDTFDTVCVQFSGGKDSTAVLYLAKEIHEERDLGPVRAIFRDEEMVSPMIVDYISRVREYDWVDMEVYALPYGQEAWTLGRREFVLLWSPARRAQGRLVREPLPGSITAEHFGLDPNKPMVETFDYYTMQGKKGRVAFLTGVRANESMIRYRSCVQKLHENYIVTPFRMKKSVPLRLCKPIYDWTTDDVLKFVVEEHGAEYCEYYDLAAMTGANTRVGIPLHAVAARRMNDVVVTEPDFFDRLYECYPQIDAQRRWWKDFDIESLIASYATRGWDGVRDCIEDNMLTPGIQQQAFKYSAEFRHRHQKDPYSYPLEWLIRVLLLNEFSLTSVSPVGPKTRAHTMRVAAAAADADLDSLDLQDDRR